MLRLLKPPVISSVVAVIVCFGCAASAVAAPTIELTRGSPEPVESITTQLGGIVSNNSGTQQAFFLHVKPAGGAGCGANPDADNGEEVIDEDLGSASSPVTFSRNWVFRAAGSYKLCAWVLEGPFGEKVVATSETAVAVRQPHLSLAVSAPPTVLLNQTFQVATTAQAETERQVWEYVMPSTGDGCPANAVAAADAPHAGEVLGWGVTGGPFTEVRNQTLTSSGTYLFCAYFEYPSKESVPELSASTQISVVEPPPPCTVPTLVRGDNLASVEQSIRVASCTVGPVRLSASTNVRRGGVISLSPNSGSKLATGAPVTIVESAGRPCIVPSVKPNSTVGHVERLLAAADCHATILRVHSHQVPRGRVVRLGSRAHSHLFPLTKVRIVVSSGR